MTLYIALSLH